MTSARRVGAETSKTRLRLLDAVEQLMVDLGYAGVTYRAVATRAGVTPGLVQYYFPTLDAVFVAVIRRRSQENHDRLAAALEARPAQPLRVLWDYSREESTAAVTTEFLALGNHRPSVRTEIGETSERIRRLQLDALRARFGDEPIGGTGLSADALIFLLTGMPKLIRLEKGVGLSATHAEALAAFEAFLDRVEPEPVKRRGRR